ncbi:amine sulfotransferase-like isoform X1 [Suricata suricatta]|uniref:Sulfotransferase n=1 Tax=Suricata suricatta TaxID=37032 RepID=A0A673UTG1_SURSU|nr:amine sulfotransferase-like isoform X1 [Suricata suricatta]XP_029801440.1 amine sulfotransferase-like isoform X1 [Suricata suricatta]
MEDIDSRLFKFKGYNFHNIKLDTDFIETLGDFEVREDDVFIVTYPKSEHQKSTGNLETWFQVPYFEYSNETIDFTKRPSPRLFVSHLPYYLMPSGLKNKKAKIIYVYRNPKDVMCSYFHFSKKLPLPVTSTTEEFMKLFLEGRVMGSLWFDHIKGWYEHKNLFNIEFVMYEEMKKDLRGSIVKICKFLGKKLSDKDLDTVVTQAMFENMKSDPRANYDSILKTRFGIQEKGHFLRKGMIGDWKNHMTVEQNERFDKIFQMKMKDFPLKFIWDMNEE